MVWTGSDVKQKKDLPIKYKQKQKHEVSIGIMRGEGKYENIQPVSQNEL